MQGSIIPRHGRSGAVPRSAQSRIAGLLVHFYRWMRHKHRQRRDLNSVSELSDAQLKDIGLSRHQTRSDVHTYRRD
ncbi:DUF1127 domain-containing protein [Shinella sp. BYT-45]|uniref:DUF1127 domain-containing protein n=1 Tax=Shinella sp. BYT-45 TaxID=3377377 RepID=UPI0039806898